MADPNHMSYVGCGNYNADYATSSIGSSVYDLFDQSMIVVPPLSNQIAQHPLTVAEDIAIKQHLVANSKFQIVREFSEVYNAPKNYKVRQQTIKHAPETHLFQTPNKDEWTDKELSEFLMLSAQVNGTATNYVCEFAEEFKDGTVYNSDTMGRMSITTAHNRFELTVNDINTNASLSNEQSRAQLQERLLKDSTLTYDHTTKTDGTAGLIHNLKNLLQSIKLEHLFLPPLGLLVDPEKTDIEHAFSVTFPFSYHHLVKHRLFWPQLQSIYQAQRINALRKDNKDLKYIVQLQSPTGTGKTQQFMYFQCVTAQPDAIDITLTNTEINASQLYDNYTSITKKTITYVQIKYEHNAGVPQLFLIAKTRVSQTFRERLPSAQGKINLHIVYTEKIIEIDLFKSTTAFTTSSQLQNCRKIKALDQSKSRLIQRDGTEIKYSPKQFGDVIIACAHNIQFLYQYGIITTEQRVNSVVFDEVDVYYNLQTIDEFHKLFFKYDNVANCDSLILCSATLDTQFMDLQDNMLSAKRVSIQLHNMKPKEGTTEPKDVIIYKQQDQSQFNAYNIGIRPTHQFGFVRLSTIGYEDSIAHNISQYNLQISAMQRIFNKIYIYFPCGYTNKFEYISYQQNADRSATCKYKWLHCESAKTVLKGVNANDLTQKILQQKDFAVVSEKKLHFVNTPIRRVTNINMLENFTPPIASIVAYQFYSHQYNESLMKTLSKLFNQVSKKERTLLLHFDDAISKSLVQQNSRRFKSISGKSDEIDFRKINNSLINQKQTWISNQLFQEQFQTQLSGSSSNSWDQMMGYDQTTNQTTHILVDTVEHAGRGLDIQNLAQVIVLIPLFVNFEHYNITKQQLKQAMGRVARGGKTGICTFLFIGDVHGYVQFNELTLQNNSQPDSDYYEDFPYQDDLIKILRVTNSINKQLIISNFEKALHLIEEISLNPIQILANTIYESVTFKKQQIFAEGDYTNDALCLREFNRQNDIIMIRPFDMDQITPSIQHIVNGQDEQGKQIDKFDDLSDEQQEDVIDYCYQNYYDDVMHGFLAEQRHQRITYKFIQQVLLYLYKNQYSLAYSKELMKSPYIQEKLIQLDEQGALTQKTGRAASQRNSAQPVAKKEKEEEADIDRGGLFGDDY